MNPFSYSKPTDVSQAVNLAGPATRFIAGGTNLLDLMKENIARPEHLIDITGLPLTDIQETAAGGLMIGALVSNADLAWHPLIESRYPLLSQAVLAGASPQLRNMASTGGNLLQRTRCYYFYDSTVPCNKREPGSGCPAKDGLNRIHAILGASDACVATHPSDMCVALAALEAVVHVQGRAGKRQIEFADFHRLPGDTPERDNQLADDELITAVELPAAGFAAHSHYLKIRDRASYAFALISVAAALELDGEVIRDVRLTLGGVAHKPWRDKAVETSLKGQAVSREAFVAAADAMLRDAQPLEHNAFKIKLARRAIVRALSDAATGGTRP
jgi:xanthine dehydrogenase YagS FAD-binding subunit